MAHDKFKNEPTVEIEPDLYFLWLKVRAARMAAEAEEKALKARLDAQIGAAHAGTVNGVKLVTHRPMDSYRERELVRENPHLAELYMVERTVDVFDIAAFAKNHPEVAEKYRSRQFKVVEVK